MTKKGWHHESARHSLAARGVRTKESPHKHVIATKEHGKTTWDKMWQYLYLSPYYDDISKSELAKEKSRIKRDYYRIKGVPPRVARAEMLKHPEVIDPNQTQNDSPEMFEMIEATWQYNGTLEGYVIPPESGRDDARVTFDGFTVPVNEYTAKRMRKDYHPDEFDKKPEGYRFWWD